LKAVHRPKDNDKAYVTAARALVKKVRPTGVSALQGPTRCAARLRFRMRSAALFAGGLRPAGSKTHRVLWTRRVRWTSQAACGPRGRRPRRPLARGVEDLA
jgi:hypothetical protein